MRFRAAELIARHGSDIARIVRGEVAELSEEERREILSSQMSYFPEDLLVAGWIAAFLCDTPEGATPTVQLLEYANTQLLEFRYYDSLLSKVLVRVYDSLDKRAGVFARWRLAREAQGLNKIRLDVRELTERIDTSIKFLSVCSPRAFTGWRRERSDRRLPAAGRKQAQYGRRFIHLHDGSVSRQPRFRAGTDRGRDPGD